MCANNGYLEGQCMTNFSCRVARCAVSRGGGKQKASLDGDTGKGVYNGGDDDHVNIIAMLKAYAERVPGLRELLGDDFARGHKQVRKRSSRPSISE